MKTHPRRESGFTLMEMMLVIGIMAILMGAGIYYLRGTIQAAAVTRAEADINQIATLISTFTFRSHNLQLPDTLQDLVKKPENVKKWEAKHKRKSKWSPLLRDESDLIDPWGNLYRYEAGGNTKNATFFKLGQTGTGIGEYMKAFDIWSWGPGGDDKDGEAYGINNWGSYKTEAGGDTQPQPQPSSKKAPARKANTTPSTDTGTAFSEKKQPSASQPDATSTTSPNRKFLRKTGPTRAEADAWLKTKREAKERGEREPEWEEWLDREQRRASEAGQR